MGIKKYGLEFQMKLIFKTNDNTSMKDAIEKCEEQMKSFFVPCRVECVSIRVIEENPHDN